MNMKRSVAGIALLAGAVCLTVVGGASAKPNNIDPNKVSALAAQIESALAQLGPDASASSDIAAIDQAIESSGASPSEAEAALEVVQGSHDLSRAGRVAVASVDKSIEVALTGPFTGPGGAGGGQPIGSPPSYAGGGGSDYLVR